MRHGRCHAIHGRRRPREITHNAAAAITWNGRALLNMLRDAVSAACSRNQVQHHIVGRTAAAGRLAFQTCSMWRRGTLPRARQPIRRCTYWGHLLGAPTWAAEPGLRRSRATFCRALTTADALRMRCATTCSSNAARCVCAEGEDATSGFIAARSSGVRSCVEFPMAHANRGFRERSRRTIACACGLIEFGATISQRQSERGSEWQSDGASPNRLSPGTNRTMANSNTRVQREFVALRRASVTYSDAHRPVFHAVTPFCRIALCSTEPGVKSGWAEPPAVQVTCTECLRRLARL